MEEKISYTREELETIFRPAVEKKLKEAEGRLKAAEKSLKITNRHIAQKGIEDTDDGFIVSEQENLNSIIIHLHKFVGHLKRALLRIDNGTYGVCVTTKKLINKERLLLVPHTTHSVEAKNKRDHIR